MLFYSILILKVAQLPQNWAVSLLAALACAKFYLTYVSLKENVVIMYWLYYEVQFEWSIWNHQNEMASPWEKCFTKLCFGVILLLCLEGYSKDPQPKSHCWNYSGIFSLHNVVFLFLSFLFPFFPSLPFPFSWGPTGKLWFLEPEKKGLVLRSWFDFI